MILFRSYSMNIKLLEVIFNLKFFGIIKVDSFQLFFSLHNDNRFNEIVQSEIFATKGFQIRAKKVIEDCNEILLADFSSKIPQIKIEDLIISLTKM